MQKLTSYYIKLRYNIIWIKTSSVTILARLVDNDIQNREKYYIVIKLDVDIYSKKK